MTDHTFTISAGELNYQMVLPHWETDYIQGLLAKNGEPYELGMLQAMAAHLAQNDLVLDVGANIGNHTFYLASVCGCRIKAFEPNPDLCKPFRQTIALNSLEPQVELYEVGVGEASGHAHFAVHTPENLGGQSLKVEETEASSIQVITLDSLNLQDRVRAIKVDVEGMELAVLEGARTLIARDMPYLFVEAQTEVDFEALQAVVVDLGYVYWDTFNATPTHWFIHKDELGEERIIDHYFEKGRDSYKLRLAKREVQQKLSEANRKYREANIRIDALKSKLEAANENYRKATADYSALKEKHIAELEQLRSQLEKARASTDISFTEDSLAFDFSISDEG